MRKQFAATIRVVDVPKATPQIRRLSLEEEALVIDQGYQDQQDVCAGLDEVKRLTEISDALEDLAVVAANIRQASPTEIALIETVGQVAVAGSDNEPELMLPAMESFQEGKSIAVESIAEKAKVLWKNLLEFLARIWEKIVAFFRMHVVVREMRQKIATMIKAVKEGVKGRQIAPEPETLQEFSMFFNFDGKLLTKIEDMVGALKATIETARFIYEDNPAQVKNAGEKIEGMLQSYAPEKSEELLEDMVKQLGGLRFDKIPHAKHDGREGEYDVYTSQSFIGGGKLIGKVYRPAPGMHSTNALELIRNSGIVLEKGEVQELNWLSSKMTQFDYPTGASAIQVLQAADTLLSVIENFHERHVNELKQLADKLKAASAKAAQAVEAKTLDNEGDALRDFKAAVNLNVAFARWSQQPALPFYSHVIRTARFALQLAQFGVSAA